jgi:hypothetical protein
MVHVDVGFCYALVTCLSYQVFSFLCEVDLKKYPVSVDLLLMA